MARAHGTYGRYKTDGCRCEACRMAHNRAKLRKEKVTRHSEGHGTVDEYRKGCRCVECAGAYSTHVNIETAKLRSRWF